MSDSVDIPFNTPSWFANHFSNGRIYFYANELIRWAAGTSQFSTWNLLMEVRIRPYLALTSVQGPLRRNCLSGLRELLFLFLLFFKLVLVFFLFFSLVFFMSKDITMVLRIQMFRSYFSNQMLFYYRLCLLTCECVSLSPGVCNLTKANLLGLYIWLWKLCRIMSKV